MFDAAHSIIDLSFSPSQPIRMPNSQRRLRLEGQRNRREQRRQRRQQAQVYFRNLQISPRYQRHLLRPRRIRRGTRRRLFPVPQYLHREALIVPHLSRPFRMVLIILRLTRWQPLHIEVTIRRLPSSREVWSFMRENNTVQRRNL